MQLAHNEAFTYVPGTHKTSEYELTPMIILKCLMFLAKRWACVQLFNTEVF